MKKEQILFEIIDGMYNGDADFVISDYLSNSNLNSCDKCEDYFPTEELIWLSSEDFEPKENEIVPDNVYRLYDALCIDCYLSVIGESGK